MLSFKSVVMFNNFFFVLRRLDEKSIPLDKDGSSNHNETVSSLTNLTQLPHKPLTDACHSLLNKLDSCASSARVTRDLIRSYASQEPFDLAVHTDLNFTKVMRTHS